MWLPGSEQLTTNFQMGWFNHLLDSLSETVDGSEPLRSPVEVGSFSHYL